MSKDIYPYPTNDKPEEIATSLKLEKADNLLLYQAKQNVREKKNLIKHVVVFTVAWFVIGLFYIGFIQDTVSPEWWNISSALQAFQEAKPNIPEQYLWAIDEVQWVAERHLFFDYTPDVWYVILGSMFAWGGWIACRGVKCVARPIKKKLLAKNPTKRVKPDPVIQEYNRLKEMATDEVI